MNYNQRLNVDTYFNHIRDTNRIFLNYMNVLEMQENNLTSLLNTRNNNTIRGGSFYPYVRRNNNTYNRWLREQFNDTNIPANRLTNIEINRYTTVCNFREINNPINHSCPITFEDFSPDTTVMIINHCRHIFNETSLRSWFTYNTHCPMCRHNLRNSLNSNITNVNTEEIRDSSSNLSNVFDNILNTYSNYNNTTTTMAAGTIYDSTRDEIINDISNNSQNLLNEWNQNIMTRLSELISDDVSGNIQLEYRMYSS